MDKKDVKIWTEALRSGEYKKGKFCLHEKKGKNQRFCCLGVAADVLVDADWIPRGSFWTMDGKEYTLSDNIRERLGISRNVMWKLIDFNDGEKSFSWIAD